MVRRGSERRYNIKEKGTRKVYIEKNCSATGWEEYYIARNKVKEMVEKKKGIWKDVPGSN